MDNFAKPIIDSYISTLNHEFVLIQYNILYTNTINNGFILEEIRIYILHITNCLIFSFYIDTFLGYATENIKSTSSVSFKFRYFTGLCRNNGTGRVWSFYPEPNNTHGHNVIRQTSLHELIDRDWNTIMDRNSWKYDKNKQFYYFILKLSLSGA